MQVGGQGRSQEFLSKVKTSKVLSNGQHSCIHIRRGSTYFFIATHPQIIAIGVEVASEVYDRI